MGSRDAFRPANMIHQAGQQPARPVINQMTPLNGVQIVGLVAAGLAAKSGDADDVAVARAFRLMAAVELLWNHAGAYERAMATMAKELGIEWPPKPIVEEEAPNPNLRPN